MSGIYEKKLRLLTADTDMWRHLRPSVLAGFLQSAATAHAGELGAGTRATLDRGVLWIIARMAVEVERMPGCDEDVLLRTWPGPERHTLFPRYYELLSPEGGTLLRASSIWLLMDAENRRMVPARDAGIQVEGLVRGGELPLPSRIGRFPDRPAERSERTVRYSETDVNGHLNNTRYLDWADDLLSPEFHRSHILRSLLVEYRSEIRLGQAVELESILDNGTLYLRGKTGGKESFLLREEYDTV